MGIDLPLSYPAMIILRESMFGRIREKRRRRRMEKRESDGLELILEFFLTVY